MENTQLLFVSLTKLQTRKLNINQLCNDSILSCYQKIQVKLISEFQQ